MRSPSTSVSPVTRRRFLAFSGVAAAGALGLGATRMDWAQLLDAAATNPLDPAAGVLVVVTLYGGNDGLNTLVPAADPAYQDARPELAYRPEEVLDLGEGLGLNPGLTGLKAMWDARELAVVRGVGYPQADRSHFRSMAIWQTASPVSASTTGWLGRWLDASTTDPLTAVSLESVLPALLAGEKVAAASFPLSGLALPRGPLGEALRLLGRPDPADGPWQARVATSLADLQRAAGTLGPAAGRRPAPAAAPDPDPNPDEKQDQGASAGGAGELGAQLEMVANLVELGVPTRAYSVSLGGFDTHSDERGTQERLLKQLDAALSGFHRRLQGTERGRQVVVLVYSEFGRRVRANGSDGTDHGTAGPVFVLGRGVRGGFHGAQPSLTDLDDGDLKHTTDFRAVYASLLDGVLGADPIQLLDGWSEPVDGLLG
jgi:uncharacterized protein (DUF1501 family)